MADPPQPVTAAQTADAAVGGEPGRLVDHHKAEGAVQSCWSSCAQTVASHRFPSVPQLRDSRSVNVEAFLQDGLAVKQHLSRYLELSLEQVEQRLPGSTDDLADLHPGAFRPEDATAFYEDKVGTGHLLELAAWHLSSCLLYTSPSPRD